MECIWLFPPPYYNVFILLVTLSPSDSTPIWSHMECTCNKRTTVKVDIVHRPHLLHYILWIESNVAFDVDVARDRRRQRRDQSIGTWRLIRWERARWPLTNLSLYDPVTNCPYQFQQPFDRCGSLNLEVRPSVRPSTRCNSNRVLYKSNYIKETLAVETFIVVLVIVALYSFE